MSNDRGQGAPPKAPSGGTPAATSGVGRPLRGPHSSAYPPARNVTDARGSVPPRTDEVALLHRKIAELEADASEAEARAVKAEREQGAADEVLGQMLARVSDVEARLRVEQKRAADAEAGAPQATRSRGATGEAQPLDAQTERLRGDLTLARREAATHRLAAEDALHLLATARDETAELRARLDREQEDREALWVRIAEQDRLKGERDQAGPRARELTVEIEARSQAAAAHERELMTKLEQAWVEIRHAHEGAEALEELLAAERRHLAIARAAADDARRDLAAERAAAAAGESDVARLELGKEVAERALADTRAEIQRARAAQERALEALREAHTTDLAEALAEGARRERSAVEAEVAAGRREVAAIEESLAVARREVEAERAAVVEAQGLLAGEREWVAEMEEDNLRREEDLEKTRRAQGRAEAHARAAEARRVELEDSLAEAERAVAVGRGEIESLRIEAAMARMRIAEMERARELSAGHIEVNAVPAEIERLRRRVASAEARASQMHGELASAIDEVTLLLSELERREVDAARVRAASLASARSLLEHVTAATRPTAKPAIEVAISALVVAISGAPAPVRPAPAAPDATKFAAATPESATPDSVTLEPAAKDPERVVVPPPLPSLEVVGDDDTDDEATVVVARRPLSQPPTASEPD